MGKHLTNDALGDFPAVFQSLQHSLYAPLYALLWHPAPQPGRGLTQHSHLFQLGSEAFQLRAELSSQPTRLDGRDQI